MIPQVLLPPDLTFIKEEEDRLSEQNDLIKEIFHFWQNRLHPDFIGDPQSVLDCGYGSAFWAAEMAIWDSNCQVSNRRCYLNIS